MYVLGVWDGHDAGACLVENGRIKVAVNEERLTRKKLFIGFPERSIRACLNFFHLKPPDIKIIAACGTQFTRLLARQFPYFDREFYRFRRRLIPKPMFERSRRLLKYKLAELNLPFSKKIAEEQLKRKLKKLGFKNFKLFIVDHHLAHAASAIFCSGFKKALCITLDGVGDGLSGSINIFEDGEIERIQSIPARDSLGMLYEQVTTLLGMRELEDEGKTMCLADYSYPLPEEKNRLLNFFKVDGLRLISRFSNVRRFLELEKILWNCKREEFAYMAQKTLEKHMLQLFINAIEETGLKNVCWSGGVASNIKANRIIRLFSGLKDWFVFPHMGDGGLAVGAALYVDHLLNGCKVQKLENVYLGLEFNDEAIEEELKKWKEVEYEYREDTAGLAADLISEENYLFWFKGRVEYGPRALGNRSILAPAWSERVKDELNLKVKRRGWFQPFCPSLLEEESKKFFEDYNGKPDNFMTMGFMSRKDVRERIKAVLHVDGSSRPQMVCNENKEYRMLLEKVKKNTGDGIVLNTSFNIHGEPIVCSPRDALETMLRTKTRYMILGNFFVELRR